MILLQKLTRSVPSKVHRTHVKLLASKKNEGRNLPSEYERKVKKFIEFGVSQRRRVMRFVFSSMLALFGMMLQVDSKGLLSEVVRECADSSSDSEDRQFRQNVIELADSLPEFSLQRKTLEVALSKSYE